MLHISMTAAIAAPCITKYTSTHTPTRGSQRGPFRHKTNDAASFLEVWSLDLTWLNLCQCLSVLSCVTPFKPRTAVA
eukprot:2469769-Amphidinium_carterae.2